MQHSPSPGRRGAALACVLAGLLAASAAGQPAWRPAPGPLATRWAADVSPERVHPEYPRPQLVRRAWMNLNGLWDYALTPAGDDRLPGRYDGRILVPFPIESSLSGVMKRVGPEQRLWYHRTFELPAAWKGQRLLLHFGASDWETDVSVDLQHVGTHRGGYTPFTFDVTDALSGDGPHRVDVRVWDPSDAGTQPRGKQVRQPEGIWYTPTTGLWQTVWLEPVPAAYVGRLKLTPDLTDGGTSGLLHLEAEAPGADAAYELEAVALDGGRVVATSRGVVGRPLGLHLPAVKRWTPETPFLYDLRVRLRYDGAVVDSVESYFGMREAGLARDAHGKVRLTLNGEPVFHFGPLDQGFWPDGLYTAPTDEALRYDIELTKALGFNMARKHVKVEPARWYYWADRLGLLVWQDMPSGDAYATFGEADVTRADSSARQFERELRALVDGFYNAPSIVMWVVFNEGWGQYDTERLTNWVMQYDPSRLVNGASGWNDRGVGHVNDLHSYPGPDAPAPEAHRAVVLGEYGGLGLPVAGHTWQAEENWGYQSFQDAAALEAAYLRLLDNLKPLVHVSDLAAAVYTQTTDVEIEVNGLTTYDRAVIKMDTARVAAANRSLYRQLHGRPPVLTVLVPTAEQAPQQWRYTTEAPAGDWFAPAFDDGAWKEGPAGFGHDVRDGAIRTPWTTPDLWLRRTVDLGPEKAFAQLQDVFFDIWHDGTADVYLNGHKMSFGGWADRYRLLKLDPALRAALRPGKNTLAVHVRNNDGGQFIDVGLINLSEEKP